MAKGSHCMVIAESPSLPQSTGFRQACQGIAIGWIKAAGILPPIKKQSVFLVLRFRLIARFHGVGVTNLPIPTVNPYFRQVTRRVGCPSSFEV